MRKHELRWVIEQFAKAIRLMNNPEGMSELNPVFFGQVSAFGNTLINLSHNYITVRTYRDENGMLRTKEIQINGESVFLKDYPLDSWLADKIAEIVGGNK